MGPGCWWDPGALPAPHPALPAQGNGLLLWHSWLCRTCVVSRAASSQQSAEQHLAAVLPAPKHLAAWLANRHKLPSEGQMPTAHPTLLV